MPAPTPTRNRWVLTLGRWRLVAMAALIAAVTIVTGGCSVEPDADHAASTATHDSTAPQSAAPAAVAPSTPMATSTPVRLQIPAIGVDSDLMALGLKGDGSLEVPPQGFPAGWYTGAPTPGELGPAIIAGHVDWEGSPGVFFALRDLAPGEEVIVDREDGSTARFRVQSVQQFPKEAFPSDAVYADIDHAGLRLITCGGSFDPEARSYRDNIVVFAELAGTAHG